MKINLNRDKYTRGVSSRGTALEYTTLIDVIDIIKEKTPYYYEMIKSGKIPEYQQMYRGAGHLSKEASSYSAVKLYNPKEYKRHSAHTENYYTEIMDNSKYWKDYPHRGNSIVGSTDLGKAKGYGTLYHIIPLEENSIIAVAPSHDIWDSFDFALDKMSELFKENKAIPTAKNDFESMGGFNNFLRTKFGLDKEEDYENMVKKIILNDKVFANLDRESTYNNSRFDYDKEQLIQIQNKWGTFLNYIEYLLSPKWNGFKTVNYNSKVILPANREIWTDSNCLLIEHSVHEKVLLALE